MGQLEAQLRGESAVEVAGGAGGVAEVDDEVVGRGQLGAEVADGGRLADAGLGGEKAQAWLIEQIVEVALELAVPGRLGEVGGPDGVAVPPRSLRSDIL